MNRLTKRVGSNVVTCKFDMDFVLDMSEKEYAEFMKLMEKIAYYEDAEEERRLVILPCDVGDKVYISGHVNSFIINNIVIDFLSRISFSCMAYEADKYGVYHWVEKRFMTDDIGKTVFLNKDEFESALEKMKGEHDE